MTQATSTPADLGMVRWINPAICAAVVLALWAFVFWEFIARQIRYAIHQQADWGHTIVIPAIAGYFVYLNRDKIFSRPLKPAWIGLAPLILGIAWYTLCAFGPPSMHHHNLKGAGVMTSLFGLALLLCGWHGMKYLWFPLAYIAVFGQTISDRFMELVTWKMQQWTAIGSELGLAVLGFDVNRLGTTISIFHGGQNIPLNIAEACSGMRMLMAFLALGVAMAYTGLKRNWQRVLLVLMAFPTAIFVNILRVMTLGLLSMYDVGFAGGEFHNFVGLVWLVPAFAIYLGLMWIIRKIVVEPEGTV